MSKIDEALAVLGFDPSKSGALPKDAVDKALGEIRTEANEKEKADAKKILLDLIAIVDKKAQIVRDFNKACQKIDGEAGQLLKRLKGQSDDQKGQGGPQVPADAAE